MKIAITTNGSNLEAPVGQRFGRAERFMVIDPATLEYQLVENPGDPAQGAGIQSAERVARLGVSALITGHCGPKAYRVLQAAGIEVYVGAQGSVAEVLEQHRQGRLQPAVGADVEGHWV